PTCAKAGRTIAGRQHAANPCSAPDPDTGEAPLATPTQLPAGAITGDAQLVTQRPVVRDPAKPELEIVITGHVGLSPIVVFLA
ncbi:hypothetical protein ACPWML_26885, partial [Pandoraea pneumonica]|uniref:hypothetical protein n=1 Tax=Pandoraea pneumonica TaxID=2508299 RepID=UPI003CF34ADF